MLPLWEIEQEKGNRDWFWLLKNHCFYIEIKNIDSIENILKISMYVKSFNIEKCQNNFNNIEYYKINGVLKIKSKAIIPYSISFNQMVDYLTN
jgi:hypothetical protein